MLSFDEKLLSFARTALAEDIGNVLQGSSSPNHLRRGAMPENVSAETRCSDAGLLQAASCDPGNRI